MFRFFFAIPKRWPWRARDDLLMGTFCKFLGSALGNGKAKSGNGFFLAYLGRSGDLVKAEASDSSEEVLVIPLLAEPELFMLFVSRN